MNCSPLGEVNSAHGVSQQLLYTARTRFHLESLMASHCPVTVNNMKRIPFAQRDLKKLPDLAKQLLAGLDLLPEGNRNKASQLMALICLYDSFMDLKYQVDKTPFPQPASIQRSDIALLLAIGLRQLTHLPFLEAFKRAQRSKLDMLTVFKSTKEYAQYLQASEDAKKGIIWDEYPNYMPGPALSREQVGILHRAGVPDFDLVVRKDGKAFQWQEFVELFTAVQSAPHYAAQVEPELVRQVADPASLETFTREVLVPNSWIDLEELIKAGLEVPYHEVIWLFDKEGKYIARAFRHTVHGGVLGHLMATDDQVLKGKVRLLQGRTLIRATPMGESLMLDRVGSQAVFVLRPGAQGPRSVTDPMATPVVSTTDLVELSGVTGDYQMVYRSNQQRDDWDITGNLVNLEPGTRDYIDSYIETTPWLWEPDLPHLYAHYDGPRQRKWDSFSDQNVFLPSGAVEFQDRAMKLLQRTMRQAAETLSTAAAASMLLEQLGQVTSIAALEAYALSQYENEFACFHEDQLDEARARIHSETVAAVDALLQRRPALSIFGVHSLWFALVGHHSTIDEITVEEETLEGLLSQLVVLAAAAAQALPEIDYFQAEIAAIAVAQWMTGKIGLSDVISVATGLYDDARKLYRQRERIQSLTWHVNGEIDRRAHARELGYLYVGRPLQQLH